MLDSSPCRLLLSPGTRWAPRLQCTVARTVDCTVSVTVSATRSDIRATTASRISEREETATSSFASVGGPSAIFAADSGLERPASCQFLNQTRFRDASTS